MSIQGQNNKATCSEETSASLTEVAKHFRKRLRKNGVAARCKSYVSCGKQYIRVSQPESPETSFTDEQQREILLIAYGCRLVRADYQPLDLDARTYGKEATFILPEVA